MLKNLRLQRPLAAIDLETTGLLEHDPRIVELAVVRVNPDLSVKSQVWRLNPGRPIPAAATAIHGITDLHVAGCPRFTDILPELTDLLWACDLCGFNVLAFDLVVLELERGRAGLAPMEMRGRAVLDAMWIFHWFHPPPSRTRGYGTLAAACHRYLGAPMPGRHGALADALASLWVLDAQMLAHPIPRRVDELAAHGSFGAMAPSVPAAEPEPAQAVGTPLFPGGPP